ncbi:hypothetical protein ACFQU7_14340 [Pseudoroseomonas wenyumeiae]
MVAQGSPEIRSLRQQADRLREARTGPPPPAPMPPCCGWRRRTCRPCCGRRSACWPPAPWPMRWTFTRPPPCCARATRRCCARSAMPPCCWTAPPRPRPPWPAPWPWRRGTRISGRPGFPFSPRGGAAAGGGRGAGPHRPRRLDPQGRRAPSGMQRVQLEIASAALAGPHPPVLCAMPAASGGWRRWPAALFHRIDHLMRLSADAVDPPWRDAAALLADVLEEAPLFFAPGAVLCSLGGSWAQPDHLSCLRRARAATGLRHVPLLHDCAPLVVPEHCSASVVRGYARWFSNLALHADGVLAISHATREDFARLHAALLPDLPPPPQAVLRLDATPRPPPPEARRPCCPARCAPGGPSCSSWPRSRAARTT